MCTSSGPEAQVLRPNIAKFDPGIEEGRQGDYSGPAYDGSTHHIAVAEAAV
jgi:hypothetical protein